MIYGMGLLPDPPDKRDLLLRRFVKPEVIPGKVDYRRELLGIRDQGNEGICVGMAASSMKEFQEIRDCGLDEYLSPRYIYTRCKERDGYPGEEGTSLRVAMGVLVDSGVCLERTLPYIPYHPGKITERANLEAAKFRIQSYARLMTILDMEKCLAGNGPFCLGLDITPVWNEVSQGIIADPPRRYRSLGGHAILVCGYDRPSKHFLIRNSWDEIWGNEGYAWISYRHVERCLISAWSSVDIPGSKLVELIKGGRL